MSLGGRCADFATIIQPTHKGVLGIDECGHHHLPDCRRHLQDCPGGARIRNIRVPEVAQADPFNIRHDENRQVELVPERLPLALVGVIIPTDPMTGFTHEQITALPLQESDHVPTVKLQYHEGVYHRGLPCGQDYPHLDRRLRRLVVFLHWFTTAVSIERWLPIQGITFPGVVDVFRVGVIGRGTAQKAVWPDCRSRRASGVGGSSAPWLGMVHASPISTSDGWIAYIAWSMVGRGNIAFMLTYHLSSTVITSGPLI